MRKLLVGVCLIVAFVFAGCASSAIAYVYDPEIPEDQMSFLWVPNYILVKQFGGKTVHWSGAGMSLAKVGVPPGEHKFIIDTVIEDVPGLKPVKDQSFTKNFETGKGYQLINRNGEIVLLDL